MSEISNATLEYIFNKFIPYLLIFILLFTNFNLTDFEPWVISCLIFFIDKYAFKIGRSVGEYENNPVFKQEVDESFDKED
tara:strand:- start:14629 stop:14868 length:240 start_codon:yes stop_codon:yes gene_type:complete